MFDVKTDIEQETVDVIRRVVEKQLAPMRIVDVSVEEEIDDDDDDRFLRIRIFYGPEGGKFDPGKAFELWRHLREPLEKVQEDRFPLFSYIKSKNAKTDATA